MATKPSVFIGSSSEGLKAANVLQSLLAERVQARIWNDGVIHLGETTIESLVGALHEFDFAVLVFTPDDAISSRNQRQASPRDNVVFELGLFTGGLGRNRSYLVVEDGAGLKIPTDLRGVTYAPYRRSGNISLEAALAPVACKRATPVLHVYTWADYIRPDLISRFEKENGCRIVIDTFDSNEAMYAKLKAGASGYDVVTPSSYMVKIMQDHLPDHFIECYLRLPTQFTLCQPGIAE